MTANITALRRAFEQQFGRAPELIAEAPGRVNLIGEHTDYNGGFVLPVAIDRTVAVAMATRDDGVIRAFSVDYGQCDEFPAERVRRFMGTRGGWRDYTRGVVWALLDAHIPVPGVDIAITGDVPQGAGLSSSAAIEVAVAGALMAGTGIAARDLALLCQKAENLFAGIGCGIMDQFTSVMGQRDHALFIDCRSLQSELVPLLEDIAIVIVDSKIPRKLADTAFNRRREECAEAARALGVDSLRDADESMLPRLSGDLLKRARHVVTENTRVLSAIEALRSSDVVTLGRLLHESHASLRDDFEVSTPELDLLVELASRLDGVVGARLTGAGFGGCTVNLVREEAVGQVREAIVVEYNKQTGLAANVHVCVAVDGLRVSDA
ncbi:MAG: galactokinase [Chloroflexota bacterium]